MLWGLNDPEVEEKPQIFHYATLPSSNRSLWKRCSFLCHPACPGVPWEQPTRGLRVGRSMTGFLYRQQKVGCPTSPISSEVSWVPLWSERQMDPELHQRMLLP
jgi:hypothetical protein